MQLRPQTHRGTVQSRRLSPREALQSIFDEVRVVDVMDSGDAAHLSLMKRPDLGVTLTKLHCWTLTRYSKCVFMDADTLVRDEADALEAPAEMHRLLHRRKKNNNAETAESLRYPSVCSGSVQRRRALREGGAVCGAGSRLARLLQLRRVCLQTVQRDAREAAGVLQRERQL